jgi:anti-sigma regulatory factor (Ser/Thr protein kinase)/Na+-translocating ferredoxin:NAD+ oxidoreductase RNF subunit RnfB
MITMSCRIEGGDFDAAGLATRRLKEQMAKIGVDAKIMRRAMIASYEAEMNVVIHARTGTLWARLDEGKLDLEIADEGPGIPDVQLALREGWSTASEKAREMGFGAGLGLPNIRRNSDLFEIETRVGKGTRIRSTINLGTQGAGKTEAAPAAEAAPTAALSLETSRCRECLRCIFACPTAALRVHHGGPSLLAELCVGCTACAVECGASVYAIREADDRPIADIARGAVLVAPRGFFSGFPLESSPLRVLGALRELGFSEIRLAEEWEESLRAEARALAAAGGRPRPLISPLCPAVVALVESRFPSLIPNLGPWLSPLQAAGEEFPLRPVVLVSVCPAQDSACRSASLTGRLTVLTPARLSAAVLPLIQGHRAQAAGEGFADPRPAARGRDELAVNGVRHVLRVLSAAEAGALGGTALLELSLCDAGCSGSPYLSADPFLSLHRWQQASLGTVRAAGSAGAVPRVKPYAQRAGVRLDGDMARAIRKLSAIDELSRTLPGRDCGACGAPTCATFAEDVVLGRAAADGCRYAAPARQEEHT